MTAAAIFDALRSTINGLALGIPIIHDNENEREPESGSWVRFMANVRDAIQLSISLEKSRDTGVAEAWVYTEIGIGSKAGLQLARTIADAYTTVEISPLTLRTPSIRVEGRQGRWWATLVTIPYHSDQALTRTAVTGADPLPPGAGPEEEIFSAILSRFAAAFPALETRYQNDNRKEPETGLWVRVSVLPGAAAQVSAGQLRYRTAGVVMFQIFEEFEQGNKAAVELGDSIANAFRSVSVPPVVLKTPRVSNATIPRASRWWRVNVSVPFHADRVA